MAKINYPFIFEFDSRHNLDWHQLAEVIRHLTVECHYANIFHSFHASFCSSLAFSCGSTSSNLV